MSKATEMRAKTIQPQYEAILASMEETLDDGMTLAAKFKVVYPEVLEMLLNDGFDIEVIKVGEKVECYGISCVNAEEGRKGVVTTTQLPSLNDAIRGLFGVADDEEDESADDEE